MERVLVIDDDPSVGEEIAQILGGEGFRVETALSGKEGLEAARAEAPSLFLIDLVMPGTSGFQVCKTIQGDPELQGSPIIMLTLREGSFDPRYTKLFGVVDFLKKPLDPKLLVEKVWSALGSSAVDTADVEIADAEGSGMAVEVPGESAEEDTAGAVEAEGAMFSAADDVDGVSLAPEDTVEDAFRSPIRFDEVEVVKGDETAVEEFAPPAEAAGTLDLEDLKRQIAETVSRAVEDALSPSLGQGVEEMVASALTTAIDTDEITNRVAGAVTEAIAPETKSLVEESLAGAGESISAAADRALGSFVETDLPGRLNGVFSDDFHEAVSAKLVENLRESVGEMTREVVEREVTAAVARLRDDVLPGLLEEQTRGALERFREEDLAGIQREGIEGIAPELGSVVERSVFESAEKFLSGRFEEIVAERIGSVMGAVHGTREKNDMGIEGRFDTIGPRALLTMLEAEQVTGWLSVVGTDHIVDIHLDGGRIRFASSLAAPDDCRLGRILLEKDFVDEASLISARQEGRRTGRKLGEVLVGTDKISRDQLGEALMDQTRRLCRLVLDMGSGNFLFASGSLDAETMELPCNLGLEDVLNT